MIIAIDGPAGSGKSTTAKRVAEKLGYLFLDTGAMFRAVALKALMANAAIGDADAIARLAETSEIRFEDYDNQMFILLDGTDVSERIRRPDVTALVPQVATNPGVRRVLRDLQRRIARSQNVVAEGRDMGTVVFPNAELKIFLTASIEQRAQRRYQELIKKNIDADLEEIENSIRQRDEQDSTRAEAPLKMARNAIELDTSNLTISEQVQFIIEQHKRIRI